MKKFYWFTLAAVLIFALVGGANRLCVRAGEG